MAGGAGAGANGATTGASQRLGGANVAMGHQH